MIIRTINESSFDNIRKIEDSGQTRPWTDDALHGELMTECAFHFGCSDKEGDPLTAFILCRLIVSELHINRICTHPEFRRRGYARALLQHAFRAAASKSAAIAFLEVAASNTAAVSLYETAGFRAGGLRKAYYADGDDALLMNASL